MRKLIQIKIVHTSLDMGSMKDSLRKEGITKIGKKRWEENMEKIERFWDEVEVEIDSLNLDYKKVRIYQDGLPCGEELGLKIVDETAKKGSKNYQIVKKLIEKGATIGKTESAKLLQEEYRYIKEFLNAASEDEKINAIQQYNKVKDELIKKRDTFIAEKIDKTLGDDEIGLLFIGAAHNVVPKLPSDIKVVSLN
jgi:hypothetical protein